MIPIIEIDSVFLMLALHPTETVGPIFKEEELVGIKKVHHIFKGIRIGTPVSILTKSP